MLVKDSPDQIDSQRAELGTLLEQQLIAWEKLASGRQRPHLTNDGDSVLKAVARIGCASALAPDRSERSRGSVLVDGRAEAA